MNSRQWRASVLLILATLIGTSALGPYQPRLSLVKVRAGTDAFAVIAFSQTTRASGEESIAGLPGTHFPSFAGDHHFDVEDSRSNWQPAEPGSGMTSPTVSVSESVFGGVTPSHRLGIAEPFLSLSARARN